MTHRVARLSRRLSTSIETWQSICAEAEAQVLKFNAVESRNRTGQPEWATRSRSFGIRNFVRADVLAHGSLSSAISTTIGNKLAANSASDQVDYKNILESAFETQPEICDAVAADIERFKVIDPACDGLLGVYLFYKGVHALACARGAGHRVPAASTPTLILTLPVALPALHH